MSHLTLGRRSFLKAAGVTIALPVLESLPNAAWAATDPAKPPMRLVCIGNEFGMYPGAYWPEKHGKYYELTTLRGGRRCSCEVLLGAADRIILDDDSMSSLESKVSRLAPATVYSRLLAGRANAA